MNLYGVFAGNMFGMTRNKRQAIKVAKELGGTVRVMPIPDTRLWDAPTFRVCSDPLRPQDRVSID